LARLAAEGKKFNEKQMTDNVISEIVSIIFKEWIDQLDVDQEEKRKRLAIEKAERDANQKRK